MVSASYVMRLRGAGVRRGFWEFAGVGGPGSGRGSALGGGGAGRVVCASERRLLG